MSAKVLVGTSGWNYKHWADGVFYPAGLKPAGWLEYFSRTFSSVEVNYTFYNLPSRRVFENWRETTPQGFVFSLKASRFFTHQMRLFQPEVHVKRFLEAAAGLGDKLGVILFQLPPGWGYQRGRLEALCAYLRTQQIIPRVCAALELRDPAWYIPAVMTLLRDYNVSLVLADQPGFASQGPLTASFVYIRRHGPGQIYASDYPEAALQQDAQDIRKWQDEGRDVYIYFNNDYYGYAVKNARRLMELLGLV